MPIHLNIEDLLSARTVESDRIEYKQGWNPDAVYRSICAFANDFDNTGGGYILIGVQEDEATRNAKRPVKGLTSAEMAEIQQKMIGFNNLLQPAYHPHLYIEAVDEKQIIVLWVPGGSNRPFKVPEQITAKDKRYYFYIRRYANSVKANLEEQQELIALANQVPFDDRSNTQATMENMSILLVKDYLQKVKSRLAEHVGKMSDHELLARMELISGPDEHKFPRNVGLMMFAERPDYFFPCTQVEIVEFPDGDAGTHLEQEPITGPVPEQIARTLNFLRDRLLKEKVSKPTDKAESVRISTYPYQAVEETLVNAFYHRDYQQREPIEIRIYPDSIVFINHGGPDRSIRLEAFNQGLVRSRRYRNRRLGEFLKELELTEGRATGIPTILKALRENGSPAPRFTTDDDRTFFEVELFIHPAFKERRPLAIEASELKSTHEGIDALVEKLLSYCEIKQDDLSVSTQAGIQAGTIADALIDIDNQVHKAVNAPSSNVAGTIAEVITGTLSENERKILAMAQQPQDRETLLTLIGVTNQRKNYDAHMHPLVDKKWLTMTLPDKPTSPNQKYLTTLKGRVILEFLKST